MFSWLTWTRIKDFLYEILIIIIGVLLAFYATKWAEDQKQTQTEKEIIKQVYFELKENLIDLEQDLTLLKLANKCNYSVIRFLENDKKNLIP
jgi:hypothetical protein